jgi:hypothetical protein
VKATLYNGPGCPLAHIFTLVVYLDNTRPSSILDIGLGNGKLGFISRDCLDVMIGQRHRREDWKIQIDGIEIFPDYIQEHQKAIYDDIHIGDAFEVIDRLGDYDMIILGDVLEHFEKSVAHQFLDKCISHSTKHLIICIPLGEKWKQPVIYGNSHEKHLSLWHWEEFKPYVCAHEFFEYAMGRYGIFLIKKEDYIDHKIRELQAKR